ncbi:MAG: hypothetical protein HUJ26_13000 [Planctomycetaceae bacterium]|nr:hypothetical protein [Planctomycetaceae bacterium]
MNWIEPRDVQEQNSLSTQDPVPASTPTKSFQRIRAFVLIAILLLVVGFSGTYAVYRNRFESKIARIEELGGTTFVGTSKFHYDLRHKTKYPKWIRELVDTKAGEWIFKRFPRLYSIDIRGLKNPDAIQEVLEIGASFGTVNSLVLYRSAAEDHHLLLISENYPELTTLKINETQVTDSGISHLTRLRRLTQLNVQRTLITDASTPDLLKLPRLKELNIAETKIEASIPQLESNIYDVTTTLVTRKTTTDKLRRQKRLARTSGTGNGATSSQTNREAPPLVSNPASAP